MRCAYCGKRGHVMVACPDLEADALKPLSRLDRESLERAKRKAMDAPEVQEELARRRARKTLGPMPEQGKKRRWRWRKP